MKTKFETFCYNLKVQQTFELKLMYKNNTLMGYLKIWKYSKNNTK